MEPPRFDVSVVLTLHAEGSVVHATFSALSEAVYEASKSGVSVGVVAVLDAVTDDALRGAVREWEGRFKGILSSHEVSFRSLSLSRNFGISNSRGTCISILDGDDLYSKEWLLNAYHVCSSDRKSIAHPEAVFNFPVDPFLRLHRNRPYAFLDLMFGNHWSALTMAHRSVFEEIPYVKDDEVYAFQDWLWNCETAAAGYRHLIVPKTFMAVRQKLPGKSLWQNSFANNKVVRPNRLFRMIFRRDYPAEVQHLVSQRNRFAQGPLLRRRKTPISSRVLDGLHANHAPLYQAIIYLKRRFVSRIAQGWRDKGKFGWVEQRAAEVSRIEPAIGNFRRIQVRWSDTRLRTPFIVTDEMSRLVGAEKPAIYIVPKFGGNLSFFSSLCYMHAVGGPVYIISTEATDTPPVTLLPHGSAFIDLSETGLIYEERLRFLHRLLLETDPRFIHFFASEFGMELFARHPGTFASMTVFATFASGQDDRQLGMLGRYFSNYPHLIHFFHRISTDTKEYGGRLTRLFRLPEPLVRCHIPPAVSWFKLDRKKGQGDAGLFRRGNGRPIRPFPVGAIQVLVPDGYGRKAERSLFAPARKRLRKDGIYAEVRGISFGCSSRDSFLEDEGFENSGSTHTPDEIAPSSPTLLLLTSHRMGTPFLAVQALSAGIPLITMNVPGLTEIIDSGVGWRIDRDAIQFSELLKQIAQDPSGFLSASVKAAAVASKSHSYRSFKEQVTKFYELE